MLGLPLWAWLIALFIWLLIVWRARRARHAARLPNAVEGYHRPGPRGGF